MVYSSFGPINLSPIVYYDGKYDVIFFRCMSCGSDLEQHINGKITYLPVITTPKGAKPFVKEWLDEE